MKPSLTSRPRPIISLKQLVIISIILGLFFALVGPAPGSSLIIFVGSVLLVLGIYAWCAAAVRVVASFWPLAHRTQLVVALCSAGLLSYLILMQSLGQLSARDVLAVVPLAAILYAYITYQYRPQLGK